METWPFPLDKTHEVKGARVLAKSVDPNCDGRQFSIKEGERF